MPHAGPCVLRPPAGDGRPDSKPKLASDPVVGERLVQTVVLGAAGSHPRPLAKHLLSGFLRQCLEVTSVFRRVLCGLWAYATSRVRALLLQLVTEMGLEVASKPFVVHACACGAFTLGCRVSRVCG